MVNRVKQKKSPFQEAWDEANQLVYIAQFEAHQAGIPAPPAEQIVSYYFRLSEELEKPNQVFHNALAEEISKIKSQEKEND